MTVTKKNQKAISLTVTEGLSVQIIPNPQHEFLMSSEEVANAYGVSYGNIREHKRTNPELAENKHFVTGVRISDSEPVNKIFWTKRGIVRLGFFIKSQRAKLFRDWAEDLILAKLADAQTTLFDVPVKAIGNKRKHNRLTSQRMIDILTDVCKIEDTQLRNSIANKLKGGYNA